MTGSGLTNILVPMAGAGSRFASAGYQDPKPLIPIHGVPMIRLVIENLRPKRSHRFIFVCQRSHVQQYELQARLRAWAPGCELVEIDVMTDGAARTALMAQHFINNDDELMIANSDQYVDIDIDRYLDRLQDNELDGLIMTMTANDPKWSYVGVDEHALVTTVMEKEVISNEATVGIYNFRAGRDFVSAARSMIKKGQRANGEYYVAPAYNELIEDRKRIGIHNIGSEAAGMYGLGIPADLAYFESQELSRKVVKALNANP